MQARLTLAFVLSALALTACSSSSNAPSAVPVETPTNDDGSPVTGIITARFDPSTGVIPLPNNLLLSGTTDLTLNPPVADPSNFGDPTVAISALDGWSTVAPWTFSMSAAPDPSSVVAGQSVRVFEVTLTGPGGGVTGIVRELQANLEYVTAVVPSDPTGRTVAIIPTSPLKQLTSYMAVVTDDVTDARGNDATPDQAYFLASRTSPLCVGGQSTDPLLPPSTACALEPLRQLTNSQRAAAQAAGIPASEVVLTWVMTTQSITPVLQAVRSVTQPAPTTIAPTGITTAAAGLAPIADIYVGVVTLPYYLQAPSAGNPTAPLTGFWRAAPGAYVPPFNALGLDPTSTNVTFANPFPVKTADVTVPMLMTVPNAASGCVKPDAGWPIVLFQHGITSNRLALIPVSATLAGQCFAAVAIDLPLHGLSADNASPFYIEATPFGAIANERTFEVDYINNQTGAPGPDGVVDSSGAHFINLSSLLTSRDNLRQAVADLFVMAATIPTMDIDGNGAPDFDSSRIEFVGVSLGSMVGIPFLALEPTVNASLLSVPGGGIARLLDGSATFGPRIRAGLAAAAGLQPGTPDYDRFFGAAQQVVDSVDPINYGFASLTDAILLHEVLGDLVVPNAVPGAPLSGTEPLIRVLGLDTIVETTVDPDGIRGAVRFLEGSHSSLLVADSHIDPNAVQDVTVEMHRQMASMIASGGTTVIVTDTSVIRTQ